MIENLDAVLRNKSIKVMHSHHYRVPDEFAGKNVIVVGGNFSAVDIAGEISYVASRVILSSIGRIYLSI